MLGAHNINLEQFYAVAVEKYLQIIQWFEHGIKWCEGLKVLYDLFLFTLQTQANQFTYESNVSIHDTIIVKINGLLRSIDKLANNIEKIPQSSEQTNYTSINLDTLCIDPLKHFNAYLHKHLRPIIESIPIESPVIQYDKVLLFCYL